jgi:hypothetical protein
VAAVHKLIEELGKQGALRAAETEGDRRAVEAAISYMSDEEAGIGFLYSGWCQAHYLTKSWQTTLFGKSKRSG